MHNIAHTIAIVPTAIVNMEYACNYTFWNNRVYNTLICSASVSDLGGLTITLHLYRLLSYFSFQSSAISGRNLIVTRPHLFVPLPSAVMSISVILIWLHSCIMTARIQISSYCELKVFLDTLNCYFYIDLLQERIGCAVHGG